MSLDAEPALATAVPPSLDEDDRDRVNRHAERAGRIASAYLGQLARTDEGLGGLTVAAGTAPAVPPAT